LTRVVDNAAVGKSDEGALVTELLEAHGARVHLGQDYLLRFHENPLFLDLKVLGVHEAPQQLSMMTSGNLKNIFLR
jgi:hypothetical protein